MKTKRALLNIITNILGKLVTILLGIIIPKLIIETYGSETNGLLASISGIFVYLNLLEMGIGGATRQALYRPIIEQNQEQINSILSATNKFYKRTGSYFLTCISIIAFLYPLIIESTYSYIEIVFVIFITAISSAINYFYSAKYTILINADNKGYMLNILNSIISLVISLTKIYLILNGFSIIIIQLSFSIINIIKAGLLKIYVIKNYKNIDLSVKPDMQSISQSKSVLIHQVADMVFNNTDVLILSVFSGLGVVSVYALYSTIFSHVAFIPEAFSSGIISSFGHLYVENKKRFEKMFNFYEVYYITLVFIFFVVAYILIIPFMKLYTVDMHDIEYIDVKLSQLFFLIHILNHSKTTSLILINISGHFKNTQWGAVVEMIINLVFSIILVTRYGIYGVLIGSIIALTFRSISIILYTCKNIFNRNSLIPIFRWIFNFIIGILIINYSSNLVFEFNNYIHFLITAVTLTFIVSLIYFTLVTSIEKKAREVLQYFIRTFLLKIRR